MTTKKSLPRRVTGFTGIEIAIVIAVLALLGGVYYVNQNNKTITPASTVTNVDVATAPAPAETTTTTTVRIQSTTTKDETADWKTYENKEYSYSVKYPPQWEVKGDESGNKQVAQIKILSNYQKSSSIIGDVYINILSSKIADGGSGVPEDCKIMETSEALFGDEKVKKSVYTCENGDYQVIYGNHTVHSSTNYWALANQSGDDGELDTVDKILSTFKFTK